MNIAEHIVNILLDNIDSLEGGDRTTPLSFAQQWPQKPKWHPGHRSNRMSVNRNARRKSFGYRDTYSLRDRGWPTANRGFDSRVKKYERAVKRHGSVSPGEGI